MDIIPLYFVNQHFPSFPYKEMLQLSFLISVQWNIKGNRNDDIECDLFGCFLAVTQTIREKSTLSR